MIIERGAINAVQSQLFELYSNTSELYHDINLMILKNQNKNLKTLMVVKMRINKEVKQTKIKQKKKETTVCTYKFKLQCIGNDPEKQIYDTGFNLIDEKMAKT